VPPMCCPCFGGAFAGPPAVPGAGPWMGLGWALWPVLALVKLAVGLAVLGLAAYVVLRLLGLRPADVIRALREDYRELRSELLRRG